MEYTENGWKLESNEVLKKDDFLKLISLRELMNVRYDNSSYVLVYFDSANGNDNNDGLSIDKPLKTLNSLNSFKNSKDVYKFLFKKDSVFEGNLLINQFTSFEDKPVMFCSYGDGKAFPKFVGDDSVIKVAQSNVVLDGLEVTGPLAYRGIHIVTSTVGAMKNIIVKNCYVHDVNWNWPYKTEPYFTNPDDIDLEKVTSEFDSNGEKKGRYFYRYCGGIIAHNEIGPSWFENVYFINNVITKVSRTGLTIYNKWTDKPGVGYGYNKWVGYEKENDIEKGIGYYGSKNIVCYGNYVECVGADGIVISSADDVLVSSNSCYQANYLGRLGYWNASIWVYNVNNCLFEYNHASKTYMRYGSEDSQGFDLDNVCRNTFMHHNLSDNNEGGGLLVCNLSTPVYERDENGNELVDKNNEPIKHLEMGKWFNNFVYKNIFINNGNEKNQSRSSFLTIAREVDYGTFEENYVLMLNDIKNQSIINTEDKSKKCFNNTFTNNHFISNKDNGACFTDEMMFDSRFINNKYQNVKPHKLETVSVFDDNADINLDGFVNFKNTGNSIFERKINSEKIISLLRSEIL